MGETSTFGPEDEAELLLSFGCDARGIVPKPEVICLGLESVPELERLGRLLVPELGISLVTKTS